MLYSAVHFLPVHQILEVWSQDYFTIGEISKLLYVGSYEELNCAKLFVEQANEAFSDLSTPEDQLKEKYRLLSRYAAGYEAGDASETHSLELLSAHFDNSSADGYGYVWVYYSNVVKNAKGEVVRGSYEIPALWTFEKDDKGSWKLIDIKEHL